MDGPTDPIRTVEEVRKDPYSLPAGFEWSTCDINDDATATEIQKLLADYYVEDPDANFRLCYTKEFIQWALNCPGANHDWYFGVRASANGRLLAFISATPLKARINDNVMNMTEVNFLCVHPKLRQKKLALLMIREVTRRINLTGIWQAVYTGATLRPGAIATARYWHRTLNPRKLDEIGFAPLGPKMTYAMAERLYAPPQTRRTRPMTPADVPWVTRILNENSEKYKLVQLFTEEEVAYTFLPRPDIIQSFVLDETDLVSYYSLPSTIIGHPNYPMMRAAWAHYLAPGQLSTKELVGEMVSWAAQDNQDVVNVLDVAGRDTTSLWDHKFQPGTGTLHYYLFNWKLAGPLKQEEISLVLP